MNNFRGDALSWESKEGVIELNLHRPPANEIGLAMLAELEHFVSTLESASEEASAIIIYSQLKPGFSAGGDLRELYTYALAVTPAERVAGIRASLAGCGKRDSAT